MVEHQLPKLRTRVRFPSSAPYTKAPGHGVSTVDPGLSPFYDQTTLACCLRAEGDPRVAFEVRRELLGGCSPRSCLEVRTSHARLGGGVGVSLRAQPDRSVSLLVVCCRRSWATRSSRARPLHRRHLTLARARLTQTSSLATSSAQSGQSSPSPNPSFCDQVPFVNTMERPHNACRPPSRTACLGPTGSRSTAPQTAAGLTGPDLISSKPAINTMRKCYLGRVSKS